MAADAGQIRQFWGLTLFLIWTATELHAKRPENLENLEQELMNSDGNCFEEHEGIQAEGGSFQPIIITNDRCKERCLREDNCLGFDFNHKKNRCWLHVKRMRRGRKNPDVTHYVRTDCVSTPAPTTQPPHTTQSIIIEGSTNSYVPEESCSEPNYCKELRPWECYFPPHQEECCQQCPGFLKNSTDCEYGDRLAPGVCEDGLCGSEMNRHACCHTCQDYVEGAHDEEGGQVGPGEEGGLDEVVVAIRRYLNTQL